MSEIELFPKDKVIGSFKGLAERGGGFAADLVIPFKNSRISQPQLGSFILVELSDSTQATLGRITKFIPSGMLASAEGENYVERMRVREDDIPQDLKERMLKYRVQIKLLGVVRTKPKFRFTASQRRLPHLGARVVWPSDEVLKKICSLGGGGTEIGHFALGEFVYTGSKKESDSEFEYLEPPLPVTFDINKLIARRTAVFARAGYGKSNLMKYLVSELYRGEPKTERGRPVGMLIFDADGEYFWSDSQGRPGLCDVPHLADKLALFSSQPAKKEPYKRSLAGGVKLDIRQLRASDVFSIALTPERQEQQNVLKLKGVKGDNWRKLVDLVASEGLRADFFQVGKLLGYGSEEQMKSAGAEMNAALSNVNFVVNLLHDPDSNLLNGALRLLAEGCIVVVDISLLSARGGEIVSGLLMRKIFSQNQETFTSGELLPVIAVLEEAQRTLGGRLDEASPFVEWVKEGRKYALGAVLITQQPGSLAGELLSQVDNWFCFHLLSRGDAAVLEKYNSHFSEDVLNHMIAEPIRGNCFMWSAPDQPFVLPARVHEFKAEGEASPSVSVCERVSKNDSETMEKMRLRLADEIKKEASVPGKLGLKEFGAQRGIKDGKLFHLIKNSCGELLAGAPIDDLKEPLFKAVFGEDMRVAEKDGEKYFCAPAQKWDEVVGKRS